MVLILAAIKMKKISPKATSNWSAFRRYLQVSGRAFRFYYHINPPLVIFDIFLIAYTALIPLANAWILKLIIDTIIHAQRQNIFPGQALGFLLSLYFLLRFSQRLAWRLSEHCDRILYLDGARLTTVQASAAFANLTPRQWENPQLRNFINKVQETYGYRPINFANRQLYLLQNLIGLVGNTAAITSLGPVYFLLLLLSEIPDFWVRLRFGRHIWSIYGTHGDIRRQFWHTSNYITDLHHLFEVWALEIKDYLLAKLNRLYRRFANYQKQSIHQRTQVSLLASLIWILSWFSVASAIIFKAARGLISIGSLSFYLSQIRQTSQNFNGLFRNFSANFEDYLYVHDFFRLIDLSQSNQPPGRQQPQPPFTIEFRQLGFHYPFSPRWIFRHFNLTIAANEKIAIVGANGAGKTTLIKLLLRFYEPQEGQILVNGHDLRQIDLHYWRQQIGLILQDFNHYAYSFRENIYLGNVRRPFSPPAFRQAIHQAEADDLLAHLPYGEKTILSKAFKKGSDLSSGEWQKVALARAFYRRAPILILDEPTAAIDASAEARIFNHLYHLFQKRSLIIISHRFSTVRQAERIIVLQRGKIKEMGSHQELMAKNGHYARLFRLQARGYR